MSELIEISEYSGQGYKKILSYENWRVSLMNFADHLQEHTLRRIERHMKTDEVFVLLEGSGMLLIDKEMKKYPMEIGKIYNVKAAAWHALCLSEDAKVLIVENEDTSADNTEYIYFDK